MRVIRRPLNFPGSVKAIESVRKGDRTSVNIALERAASCFIVFNRNQSEETKALKVSHNAFDSTLLLSEPRVLTFPLDWGAPPTLSLHELKPWKDLEMDIEGMPQAIP